jgi:alkylation response protein AidB-like acyl-CoA dehydrogenase/rubredoxin
VEELARVDGGTGVILSAHVSLGSWPIFAYGTEAQKQKYLVPLARGEKLGAFGLTEPNAGSDAGGTETTAVLDGDHYILNGGKIFITNAPKAGTYVVFAVTTPDIGTRGISAFIVENGWKGFTFGDHYDKLGIRSSSTAELIFNDVKVPKENLLGKEGEGFKIAMSTLDGGRIGIAAQALGIAQGAYESALEYSKERVQFGKPICQQQVIAFKLADMATKLRASRFLVYSSAELKENHEPYGMESAMAKQFTSDMGLEIVNDALQIFGGNGYLKGMEVERAYRDAKICTIYEGTNEIQRVVIAAHVIGKMPKEADSAGKKKKAELNPRKKMILKEGSAEERVAALVESLKADGYDFTVGIDIDTPIIKAERVVSAGKGIGDKKNMELVKALAVQAGAALGSSRPVAETLRYLPINRYVGMSGQKFSGNLYIACGISGAGQHLKGIKDAATVVAINNNPNAPIFKNCDYGIVGDLLEILPLLTAALDNGQPKQPAPPMKKMKRAKPPKVIPSWKRYVCSGCGYEYDPAVGDPENEIRPTTLFDAIPEEWICPECGEAKDQFIEA